ncbi:DnaJ-domain-containing protein [Trematosphaeria pertusa]|uniref:DnaJ-domain-containing protein n=1 Tax=Trematosphaeria pertusa TaxID=390896 RepID=A0A6A6J3G5_9PLEO|nr:DnaJ-domain-containing protein [Trematosphaeria pertusa]KAF2256440.1 DnaJ-domain-containing protein [Trematosphaeria pertusa]
MPPRPPILLLPLPRVGAPTPWVCQTCRSRTATLPFHPLLPQISLHTSSRLLSDSLPNHYEVLQLPHSASHSEIKRQFYTLSKQHHPDRNPDDPNASTRFVAISEAYHVLSVPEKRAQYDAHMSHSKLSHWGRGSSQHPQGSFSSASFAGSRPASGLNKRRSTFRGPPPSFYKSGGYGRHGAKRAEYAHHNPHAGDAPGDEAGPESYGGFDGFGPGQTRHGADVPHFDDRRHKATHDHVNEHIYARRRRARAAQLPEEFDRGGMLVNFLMVAGVVGFIGMTAKIFSDKSEDTSKRKDTF